MLHAASCPARCPHPQTLDSEARAERDQHTPCRHVVERLSVPGVRRLIIVQPQTRHVEGILSLSDIAAYIFNVA